MRCVRFKVPIYNWGVSFIDASSDFNFGKLKRYFNIIHLSKDDIEDIEKNKDNEGGGVHFYNSNIMESLIIIYRCNSESRRRNVIAHEKRHLEDRILKHLNIKDMETAAYISGYLAEKIY